MKPRKQRLDEIHTLITIGGDKGRPADERARYALEACEAIRDEDLILVTAFEWLEGIRQWKEMRKAGLVR